MKILSIGNSFSQDAHKWLSFLAAQNGLSFETANLYIGGCSLQMHWENVLHDRANYSLERNGNAGEAMVSISQMLDSESYDVITLQQVSDLSGLQESYEPYLSSLAQFIREKQPQAKLYFHETWAYERDSGHPAFQNYGRNQETMYNRIHATVRWAAEQIGAELIPAGTVIQTLRREVPAFDYENGGLSLCRDGFHMSFDYGRLAVAATWAAMISGKRLKKVDLTGCDTSLLETITETVNTLLFE